MYFFISGSYLEFEILELTNLQVKGLTLIKQITIVLEFLNVVPNPRFYQSKKLRVVQTQAILFLNSISERGGSDSEFESPTTLIFKMKWLWSELPLKF